MVLLCKYGIECGLCEFFWAWYLGIGKLGWNVVASWMVARCSYEIVFKRALEELWILRKE